MGDESLIRDAIGTRGEAIAALALTRPHAGAPLFRQAFLGDRFPGIDYSVQLLGRPADEGAHLLIQVKSTRRGYTLTDRRLRVTLRRRHLQKLAAHPTPTYVVGVDERAARTFLVAADDGLSAGSLSTRHPVDSRARLALYEEVRAYWRAVAPLKTEHRSRFSESFGGER